MSEPGIKLTTYFGEREREGGGFLADALFDVYERHRMRTSVLLRGVEGFGERHRLQTDRLLTLSESLPSCRSRSTPASGSKRRCPRCSSSPATA